MPQTMRRARRFLRRCSVSGGFSFDLRGFSGFGAGMHDSAEALLQAVRGAGYDPIVKYVPYDWSDDRSPDEAAEYLIKRCGGDAGDAALMACARKIAAELADGTGVFVDSVNTRVAWIYWNTEA